MSIVHTIHALAKTGDLIAYRSTVRRPVNAQGARDLWLTPDALAWCQPADAHPDKRISDKSLLHLGDQFNAFVAGDFMDYRGVDMRRLCPIEKDIWEIKSYMHKPQLRVFGWFVLPKWFVGVHCAVRDDLEPTYGPKWDAAIAKAEHLRSVLVGPVGFFNEDEDEYVKNPK